MTETCITCRWALLYGARGHCLRPAAGFHRPRKISDPFTPAISADDFCGDHATLYALKLAERQKAIDAVRTRFPPWK